MLDSIARFFKAVAIVMFAAAGLVAVFYTAYLLLFLITVAIVIAIALIVVNWDKIIAWTEED